MRKGNKEARVSRRRVGMRERDRKFRDIVCNLSPKVQLAPVSNVFINTSEQQRVRITHMHKTIYFCYFSTLYLNLKPSLHNFSFEPHAVQQALPRKTPIVHSHPCLKWDLFWIHITTRQLSKMPVSTCHMSHTNSTVTYLGTKTPQQWERGRQNPCILFVLSAWLEKYFNASVKRLFHLKQSKLSQVGSSWNNNSFC